MKSVEQFKALVGVTAVLSNNTERLIRDVRPNEDTFSNKGFPVEVEYEMLAGDYFPYSLEGVSYHKFMPSIDMTKTIKRIPLLTNVPQRVDVKVRFYENNEGAFVTLNFSNTTKRYRQTTVGMNGVADCLARWLDDMVERTTNPKVQELLEHIHRTKEVGTGHYSVVYDNAKGRYGIDDGGEGYTLDAYRSLGLEVTKTMSSKRSNAYVKSFTIRQSKG